MHGYIDLHSHFIPGIDDGVTSVDQGLAMLRGLYAAGFSHVVATPHMRPSMFDNEAPGLRAAYAEMRLQIDAVVAGGEAMPTTTLSAEHYFDEIVFGRIMKGECLPYTKGRSILVEFNTERWPVQLSARLYDLRRKRLRPIIAHPERYAQVWAKPRQQAEEVRRAGGVLLLDVCALDGKYGSKSQHTAEVLLEDRAYYAACSDAHRPEDAQTTAKSIGRLRSMVGAKEAERLLTTGPQEILDGRIIDAFD